jgi:hypothetical protein
MDIFRFTYIKPGIKSTFIRVKIRFKNLTVTRAPTNFGNTYLSKEFAYVLGPKQIVTSLEHLGTVPGVQA